MTARASSRCLIRPARPDDARRLADWCLGRLPAVVPAGPERERFDVLAECAADGCLLQAVAAGRLLGLAALHLPTAGIRELTFADARAERVLLNALVDRIERLAVQFAIDTVTTAARRVLAERFVSLGYSPLPGSDGDTARLQRDLLRRQTDYGRRIRAIGEALGIPPDYGRVHRLPLQAEAGQLESIGTDVFGRGQRLAPRAARAWRALVAAAAADGVEVQSVSAFRTVDYQRALLERKLASGQSMKDILAVSAAPGYSEHHTGNAIDVSAPGAEHLETSFEATAAFRWLRDNAARHGFHLSFPRNNRHGLAYEPWHWRYRA